MTPVLTNAEKLRKLHWNTALTATNSVFAQLTFFGPAWVLFLNELNLNNTEIGFLLSLLPFSGLSAPIIAPLVARFGYKRTFVTFFGVRKLFTAGLLLIPFILASAPNLLMPALVFIVGGFALSRAVSETGMYPWAQEYIPNTIRGRYAAINDIAGRLTAIVSVAVASYVLGLAMGLDRFMLLYGIALVFGIAAVWTATHIPGGAPVSEAERGGMSYRRLASVLKDRNFVVYMAGLLVLIIGTVPMSSFLPLYMEQQVGLSESRVVLLQIGALVGGLAATYLVGWAADRYGSKPVMLSGLTLKVLMPVAYLLIPRNSDLSLPAAVLISALNGSADIAWAIGSARLLYVRVVPPDKSSQYMAVYYAAIGLIGGLSQVLGGRALDFTQGLSGQFLIFTIDPFFPLFVFGFAMTLISTLLFTRVQADSPMSLGQFAGLFLHGNPVLALESLFRYYRARDERQTLVMTERMAQTKSRLTVDELLETLKDPRFNVRFEAIISIARMESDPRLVQALAQIVDGTEVSLSVIAAWALGRIGGQEALPVLRRGLESSYRSIRAHCARALGTLRDTTVIPILLDALKTETDKGLIMAYCSALGNLRAANAVDVLLDHLHRTENEGARLELALALGRIVGHEQHFIRLLRRIREDKGTAASQAVMVVKRRIGPVDETLAGVITECADAFARDEFDRSAVLLSQLIQLVPADRLPATSHKILAECALRLAEFKGQRVDYLLLALHTLAAADD